MGRSAGSLVKTTGVFSGGGLLLALSVAVGTATCLAGEAKEAAPAAHASAGPGGGADFIGEDGAPMRLIPAGEFVMGSPDGQGWPDEHPEHQVSMKAFYLDVYEVSNALYEKFLEAKGRMYPNYWDQLELAVHGELPVVGVDWHDAEAYCTWAGKRLPTEAEWEYAARGAERREFPWGTAEPTEERANFGQRWSPKFYKDRLKPVQRYEDGRTPSGIQNLGGNVMEWVADWHDETYYEHSPPAQPKGPEKGSMKIVRGGSWNFAAEYMRGASRLKFPPRHRAADIGIRCARDAEPPG